MESYRRLTCVHFFAEFYNGCLPCEDLQPRNIVYGVMRGLELAQGFSNVFYNKMQICHALTIYSISYADTFRRLKYIGLWF